MCFGICAQSIPEMPSVTPVALFLTNLITAGFIFSVAIVLSLLLDEAECENSCFKPVSQNEVSVSYHPDRYRKCLFAKYTN